MIRAVAVIVDGFFPFRELMSFFSLSTADEENWGSRIYPREREKQVKTWVEWQLTRRSRPESATSNSPVMHRFL